MTRRPPARAGETLTSRERDVAELAARGHTNRAIGGHLYIAISTVEQHLTRIYRKLAISRRHELRAMILPPHGELSGRPL